MNYYGIVRRIYKNNGKMPYDTIVMPNLFKTFEEAVRFAKHDSDQSGLRYGYQWINETTQLETQHNSKTGKDTLYRHEWDIEKYQVEGE